MLSHEVRSPEDALLYLADCQLATVVHMALRETRLVHEYNRQKDIAKRLCNWLADFKVDVKGTRVEKVVAAGGVDLYAQRYEVPRKTKSRSTTGKRNAS